jgi:ADP-ribose pyrophosphatase
MTKNKFDHNDYEILNREVLYDGIFRLARYHIRQRLFNGKWSNKFTREILERSSAAAILPYDPILDQVILIEQFRPGALAQPSSPWLVEIPAGILDSDEKPHEVAIREAEEEAGCNIIELELICDYFVSAGCSNEYLHIFCGKTNATLVGGIHGLAEEHEDIRVLNLPVEEAFARVRNNEIKTVPPLVSLQWLELNRGWLREKWTK